MYRTFLAGVAFAAALSALGCTTERTGTGTPATADAESASLPTLSSSFPGDVATDQANANQTDFDTFSWEAFVALNWPPDGGTIGQNGDNPTVWESWSSTTDLIEGEGQLEFGQRYVPDACAELAAAAPGIKILDAVSKVDDFFQEASGNALGSPLVDVNGNFVRFEILLSLPAYTYAQQAGLWSPDHLNNLTSDSNQPVTRQFNYPCSSTATPDSGAVLVKAAWMLLDDDDDDRYHSEQALIWTPGLHTTSGEAECEPSRVGLIGLHVATKTKKQNGWIWSTFEQVSNAPDCTTPGSADATPPNDSCGDPAPGFNIFPADTGNVAQCNSGPSSNGGSANPACDGSTQGCCDSADDWCTTIASSANSATQRSRICRQYPIGTVDPPAPALSAQYQQAFAQVSSESAWQHYQLVGTQWNTAFTSACDNIQGDPARDPNLTDPTTVVPTVDGFAFLGNTTMESYDQPSCMGCHGSAGPVIGSPGNPTAYLDFIYYPRVEVWDPNQ